MRVTVLQPLDSQGEAGLVIGHEEERVIRRGSLRIRDVRSHNKVPSIFREELSPLLEASVVDEGSFQIDEIFYDIAREGRCAHESLRDHRSSVSKPLMTRSHCVQ